MDVVYERVGNFHGNQCVCLHYQPHNITGYKTKTTSALHASIMVSSLNNACPYPEPALTHLRCLLMAYCGSKCILVQL